jgi:acetoin utilization protein AcuB
MWCAISWGIAAEVKRKIPLVKAVMTPFPYSIGLREPVERARRMMEKHRIRHLPVIEGEELVGIVSDRDLRLVADPRSGASSRESLTIREIYVEDALVVELTERLDGVLREMIQRHIDSAVVVKQGRLAGIFTTMDACRFLQRLLRDFFPADDDHAA